MTDCCHHGGARGTTNRPCRVAVSCGMIAVSIAIGAAALDNSHFTPMAPYGADSIAGYEQVVFDTLIGHDYTDGWMLVKPSFSAEYVVMINRRLDASMVGWSLDKIPFQVKVATAKTPIWGYSQRIDGTSFVGSRENVPVERTRADLSSADAASFLDAWFGGLREVRYSDEIFSGTDGVTFEFHSRSRYGSTWSPGDGIPLFDDKERRMPAALRDIGSRSSWHRHGGVSSC